MAKMPDQITVKLKVIVKFRWRDILKIRLAGFKNVKHLVNVKAEQPTNYVTAPLPDEPRPRTKLIPKCPNCKQPMEYETTEEWRGFTCYQCDYNISLEEESRPAVCPKCGTIQRLKGMGYTCPHCNHHFGTEESLSENTPSE